MMFERKMLVKPDLGYRLISHSYPLHNQMSLSLVACFLLYVGYLDYQMVLWYILMFLRWYLSRDDTKHGVWLYVSLYSRSIQMAHTRRLVVTS